MKIDLANKKYSTEEKTFASTPSNKDDINANIRYWHLKTHLENKNNYIDRGKCTSVESLHKKSFEENIQRSRQEFNPSHTKVNSISYVWSDDENSDDDDSVHSDDDQLKPNQGKNISINLIHVKIRKFLQK